MEQLDLSYFFKTKAQANDFCIRLSTISEAIYQTGFNADAVLLEQFGIQKKEKFLSLLRENNVALDSTTALKDFLATIMTQCSSLPVLSLTVAFEPKEQTLQALSEWCLINIKKQLLFDIKIDPTLIAGATITLNGKYGDFSIKQKFAQVLIDTITKPADSPQGGHQSIDSLMMGR